MIYKIHGYKKGDHDGKEWGGGWTLAGLAQGGGR